MLRRVHVLSCNIQKLIRNYMKKHYTQYKNKYMKSDPAKENWRSRKNCYSCHSDYKRIVILFWFELEHIIRQAASCFPLCIVNIQITVVTLITSYSNLWTVQVDISSSLESVIRFRRILLIFWFVLSSVSIWRHCRMSWQFGFFFFLFGGGPTANSACTCKLKAR